MPEVDPMTIQFADPRPARPLRIMLYSHDTLGYGHLRRNLLIARALSEIAPQPEILLIGGMREAGAFVLPPGTDCVTLPAYAKQGDGSYQPRELGGDLARLTRLRTSTIRSAATGFDPDLLIVDNVPRGAQFELDETLKALRARGRCRIVLGLRDVIDSPSVARRQWLRQRNFETVRRYFDAVWVYGDPALYDLLDACGMAGPLGPIAQHVGYLDPAGRRDAAQARIDAAAVAGADPRPYVFCAVGGGRDGSALCEAFVRAPMPAGHRGVLVTGTQMAEELRARVHHIAASREDMTVLPFLREPFGAMAGAARLVGMGGYNTTMELLSIGKPSLIVPRCAPRREQVMRTERLAARGLVSMMLPEALSPQAIGDWLAAPAAPRVEPPDMGGLERLKELATNICDILPSATVLPAAARRSVA
jgi:predicted glycosyltransferase